MNRKVNFVGTTCPILEENNSQAIISHYQGRLATKRISTPRRAPNREKC
jgi:hypothetical protein